MTAEFRAYIDAVTEGCCEETRKASALASVMERIHEVLAVIGDALENMRPYHCDLRPWTRMRQTIRECCRRQAIGYHGLA